MAFRRYVRRWVMPVSSEIPLTMAQDVMRRDLNGRKHTVVENTWQDHPGWYSVSELQAALYGDGTTDRRTISVRYVTGGMRHGLGPSTELSPGVDIVEFASRP